MFKENNNSNESVGDKQALSVKSSNEVLEAIKQKKIVKVKSRMQNKIETTDNSSINLKHESLINCQNNIKEMTKNDSQIRLELKKFEQSEIRLKIVELETEARILKRRIFDSSESNDITGIKNGL